MTINLLDQSNKFTPHLLTDRGDGVGGLYAIRVPSRELLRRLSTPPSQTAVEAMAALGIVDSFVYGQPVGEL